MTRWHNTALRSTLGALALLALGNTGTGALAAQEGAITAPADTAAVVEQPVEPLEQVLAPVEEAVARELGRGLASWYGREFAGRRTASGERFDPAGYTAAHRSLPFGSKVRVTAVGSGRSVVVRINDRGPFSHARVIDVSQAAARDLGLVASGSGQVTLQLIAG